MQSIGIFIAVFISIFVAIFLPLMVSGKRWAEAQEKTRARRIAEAKMNARLLRLNL
jgi:preprotein translocase subunit Sec63